ncbi:Fic family protein [Prevotella sp. E15-22]|uniref:Fic family protein n=1 Tax=Prevotella sp. E15-22 TaxID=2937774 RepID=UPI00206CC06D|nr:Fic family protein [Prevotella sp. E15-22]UPS45470.1 Fic family protein [Prevotella sp. E15-22]
MKEKELYIDFDEYIRQGEPGQQEKAGYWQTAIGLQAVDGLKVSNYLQDTARKHIEGDITIDEARELVNQYYITKTAHDANDEDKEEGDRVSSNIVKVLSSPTFDFSTGGYQSIHRRVFEGVMKHAGELRTYDITKKEWVLEGDTVLYLNWEDLHRALDYDLEQERAYSYKGKSHDEMIAHLTRFVSGLWQIHAFGEGNTRTTAVFTIQYLRSLGFEVSNDQFARHSWYFRNALVRANYRNVAKGIDYSPVYLERFFRNLLLGEQWDLRNRYLHIHPTEEWSEQPNLASPHKYPTSTPQVQDKLHTDNPNIVRLVQVVREQELSVKEIMEGIGLKDRKNVLNLYLNPAIAEGYVRLLYPQSPRHPRQKYLLTVKGLALLNELNK